MLLELLMLLGVYLIPRLWLLRGIYHLINLLCFIYSFHWQVTLTCLQFPDVPNSVLISVHVL